MHAHQVSADREVLPCGHPVHPFERRRFHIHRRIHLNLRAG